VELAPLNNPNQIAERVATVLNVPEQPGREILDQLVEFLRRKELLLLLDNVEHLIRESAEFVEHLLEFCSKLTILVTGREPLFIDGEMTIQIPSLSLPQANQTLKQIAQSEGVQLFLERAHRVSTDFELDEQNAVTVAEIVRRLDGIPLANDVCGANCRSA
jgi:predicted ATPase